MYEYKYKDAIFNRYMKAVNVLQKFNPSSETLCN